MGKAEERGWVHCLGLCEESLIWFEGMPVVVGDELMAAGFFASWFLISTTWFRFKDRNKKFCYAVAKQEIGGNLMDLVIKNLSKNYKKKEAVKNVDATLSPGIWGLLGANGAGKTTLMRMMSGILEPSKGSVLYCGKDIRNNTQYRSEFGFLPQEIQFSKDLTVNNYLEYVAALKNVPMTVTKKRIDELLHILTLEDVRTKKIVKLSGGMKRRVGIAQAMLNDPKVLILDEPTAGLDPGERIRFRNFLAATSKERIVLLSTHIVSDIEDIADHVMVMKDGEFNRIVSATEYDDLEELYVSIFMNEEADHEAI